VEADDYFGFLSMVLDANNVVRNRGPFVDLDTKDLSFFVVRAVAGQKVDMIIVIVFGVRRLGCAEIVERNSAKVCNPQDQGR